MTTFNVDSHVSGDTFLEQDMELRNELGAISIVGALIKLETDRDKTKTPLSTDNGKIEITNGANGLFRIPEQVIAWEPGTYNIKLSVTFTSGRKRTYATGVWTIL